MKTRTREPLANKRKSFKRDCSWMMCATYFVSFQDVKHHQTLLPYSFHILKSLKKRRFLHPWPLSHRSFWFFFLRHKIRNCIKFQFHPPAPGLKILQSGFNVPFEEEGRNYLSSFCFFFLVQSSNLSFDTVSCKQIIIISMHHNAL